jgi:hypothetical protein
MYGWIWNHLPGPTTAVRALMWGPAFAGLVLVLFTWVFPWLAPRLAFTDVTVEGMGVHRVIHTWG